MTTATNLDSSNWSGAVLTAPSGHSFSTVSAEWVVPTVSQVPGQSTTDVAEWVGIDGFNSNDVCQAGVWEFVQTQNGKTTITYEAWDEWYPASANMIASFTVNPGNTIKVTVVTSGAGATSATFEFDNLTTGQTSNVTLSAPKGTSLQGNSAEFIVETPQVTSNGHTTQPLLSDFLNTPVVFQDASATFSAPYQGIAASLSSAETISLLSGNVQEAYGTIQAGSDSVTVTEDDYWAPSSSHGSSLFGSDYFL